MTPESKKEWLDERIKYSNKKLEQEDFESIDDIVKEIRRSDWEEFREMIERIRFISSAEGWYEEVGKKFMDECLEYYKKFLVKMIDSKISSLKSDK